MGPFKVILPNLLKGAPPIDIFSHDSSHTYEHMKLEFELALPHLSSGAFLLADDATRNTAFPEFAAKIGGVRANTIRGGAVLRINNSGTNGNVS
jgi:hypothetical protein